MSRTWAMTGWILAGIFLAGLLTMYFHRYEVRGTSNNRVYVVNRYSGRAWVISGSNRYKVKDQQGGVYNGTSSIPLYEPKLPY
jgi:hypothetical protein